MKIVVLHGQSPRGSTWNVTQMLLDELRGQADTVFEFCANDAKPCAGCFACITKDEALCPHRAVLGPVIEAIEQADVVIAESPNYCMGMSGQLKTVFDHMAYRWMSHRESAAYPMGFYLHRRSWFRQKSPWRTRPYSVCRG